MGIAMFESHRILSDACRLTWHLATESYEVTLRRQILVDMYLMNWYLNRLNVEWISVVSLTAIPRMIDLLSGELSMWWKMCITATLTPRNSGSVHVNMPNSSLKNRFCSKVMLCIMWNFEGVIHWKFVPKWAYSRCGFLFSTTGTSWRNIEMERYPAF